MVPLLDLDDFLPLFDEVLWWLSEKPKWWQFRKRKEWKARDPRKDWVFTAMEQEDE